jgi:antitoxin MazE
MQARIVKIGSSIGVILPNLIVRDFSLQAGKSLDLSILNDTDILLKKKIPREGWDLAAQELHRENGDQLLLPDVFEDEILDEWL